MYMPDRLIPPGLDLTQKMESASLADGAKDAGPTKEQKKGMRSSSPAMARSRLC